MKPEGLNGRSRGTSDESSNSSSSGNNKSSSPGSSIARVKYDSKVRLRAWGTRDDPEGREVEDEEEAATEGAVEFGWARLAEFLSLSDDPSIRRRFRDPSPFSCRSCLAVAAGLKSVVEVEGFLERVLVEIVGSCECVDVELVLDRRLR